MALTKPSVSTWPISRTRHATLRHFQEQRRLPANLPQPAQQPQIASLPACGDELDTRCCHIATWERRVHDSTSPAMDAAVIPNSGLYLRLRLSHIITQTRRSSGLCCRFCPRNVSVSSVAQLTARLFFGYSVSASAPCERASERGNDRVPSNASPLDSCGEDGL